MTSVNYLQIAQIELSRNLETLISRRLEVMHDVEQVRHDVLKLEALALHAFGTDEEYERAQSDVVAHEPLIDLGAPDTHQGSSIGSADEEETS